MSDTKKKLHKNSSFLFSAINPPPMSDEDKRRFDELKAKLRIDIKQIFGDVIIQTDDTIAAGIYQDMQFSTLPVNIDEFEGRADPERQRAVIELARESARQFQPVEGESLAPSNSIISATYVSTKDASFCASGSSHYTELPQTNAQFAIVTGLLWSKQVNIALLAIAAALKYKFVFCLSLIFSKLQFWKKSNKSESGGEGKS